jgi:hypothetical protein
VGASVKSLIQVIVSQVVKRGGYVTKTKLLKLLYLLDVEYYRVHRRTLTGFNWKFLHLGPWAREFDPLVEELIRSHELFETASSKQDYETKFYRPAELFEADGVFASHADEELLHSIVSMWAEASTGEILDYVYFRTEPMLQGIRNETLDFSYISSSKPERYARPKSGTPEKEISKARRAFRDRAAQQAPADFQFTPPRYDEEFESALEKLETADR